MGERNKERKIEGKRKVGGNRFLHLTYFFMVVNN